MTANIIIIVFILAMAYWWALQGFFSAFLHLVTVVIAGAIAFAIWEPLTLGFLMGRMPMYAWCVGLLAPFVLLLIGLRTLMDYLVKANVNFQNLVSNALGAICGIISSIITAGIAVIGLSFLPLGPALGGVQPYVVNTQGHIERADSGFWLPVHHFAQNVFDGLGGGAFATATPLGQYQPNVAQQAILYRMQYDPNASPVAVPGSVEAPAIYVQPTPVKALDPAVALRLGPAIKNAGKKLVVVDTNWSLMGGTYDQDRAVRISPPQIRLAVKTKDKRQPTLVAPVAWSHQEGDVRSFHLIDSAKSIAYGNRQKETFGWVFIIPADATPRFIFVRHLRLTLPAKADAEPKDLVKALGKPGAAAAPSSLFANPGEATEQGPSKVGARQGVKAGNIAENIELTNALPKPTSENDAPNLRVKNNGIQSGAATVKKEPGSLSRKTRIDSIYVYPGFGSVRVEIGRDRAQSLLGGARVAAASLQGVMLRDARGELFQPVAYVWLKSDGEQEINVKDVGHFTSARQLPVSKMGPGDKLYLYFAVPNGARVTEYDIGNSTHQAIKPPLVVK